MRRGLVMLLAICCHFLGITALFYFLNRKVKRICTFHNVLPDAGFEINPETSFSMSESCFRKVVRELKKHYNFSVDVFDPSTVTITFDDGNANQYEIAAEILKSEGNIPAIIFVAGIDRKDGLIVDKLCYWTAYAPIDILIRLNGAPISRRDFWRRIMRPKFVADADTKGKNTYEWANAIYPFDELYRSKTPEYLHLRMDGIRQEQLNDLRSRGWIVGWHTQSHFPLSSLSESEQQNEMTPPTEMKDVVFSYPYGELLSVNANAIKNAEKIGFPCAVGNIEFGGDIHGRYFLPRFNLPALRTWKDRILLHFQLSGLKYFVTTFKLLPRI